MQTIKPAGKQLFCRPEETITQTKSGFLLDSKAAEKPKVAEVVNIGSEVKGFSPKDKIVYKPYATVDIKLERKDFFLIDVEDVLGTVVETDD
jgi:chaperonin GroES